MRLLVLTAAVLASTLLGAGAAQAASVTYLDGEEVWVAALDGSSKTRLSEGERDWRAVTAADSGRILGVANEAGKVGGTSRIRLWDAQGTRISDGPLPSQIDSASTTMPLGLDLSSDGFFLVYGFSKFYSGSAFYEGHYVINADTKILSPPLGQNGPTWPSFFGSRVVAVGLGNQIAVQQAGTGPLGNTYAPWFNTANSVGLQQRRVDVAATGTVVAAELERRDNTFSVVEGLIDVAPIDGIGGAVNFQAGCSLPASGPASDVSISQDAKQIAWKDSQGVKVAGIPDFSGVDVCAMTSPPVVISATGSSPSIGGADALAIARSRQPVVPAPPVVPGPVVPVVPVTPPSNDTTRRLAVTVSARGAVAALARKSGLPVTVTVPRSGTVSVSATVPARRLGRRGGPVTIATGSARATKAGAVVVRLRRTAAGRRAAKRLGGARVTLRITQGTLRLERTLTVR